MMRSCWILLATLTICQTATIAEDIRFNDQVRPILAQFCYECHGPDASHRQADLRLDTAEALKLATAVPQSSESVAAKHANASDLELYRRIVSDDDDLRMPPTSTGKRLTDVQKETIRKWIEQGARYEGHWAFEPIRRRAVPIVDAKNLNDSLPMTEIDRFLLVRLNDRGLTFAPKLSKQQWIRRATLDLIGVPPSWSEVEAFIHDETPEAFSKVIDRLLESPRYGERWGRHWLDIARYADTHGGAAIGFTQFPFSYTYRDYVIRAFNADLPYDRFVLEQIAADQLGVEENDPSLAALGFLTVGMQYRNRHDTIDDQIDVVTRGLQGLTVACARCHDHKFDAISTQDYYSLYATLACSQAPDRMPAIGQASDEQAFRDYQAALEQAQTVYDDMAREQTEIMRGRLRMQVGMYLKEIANGAPEQDTSTAFLSYRTDDIRPLVLNRWRDYLAKMSDTDPVFGLWVRMAKLDPKDFEQSAASILKSLEAENGTPKNLSDFQSLAASLPKWNPLVIEALKTKPPKSLVDLAEIYGNLFSRVQQEWTQAVQEAVSEAKSDGAIVPDEDARHLQVNSTIHRQVRRYLYAPETPIAMPDKLAISLLNRTVSDALSAKRGVIHSLHLSSPGSPPRAMALQETKSPQDFFVFKRGNPLDRGDRVQPRFLSALSKNDSSSYAIGKRRLGLAQSIVDPANPLTRRVIINWVWQQHFGQGLVLTPDDFGTRGRPPVHPELLDYLAEVFRDDDWSIKKLHRRIMLSNAYAQGAVENEKARMLDPENELFWRMPRRRLDLEAMRDSLLAVSAELDTSMGGRPIDLLATPVVPRRSVYGFINRDIVSNFSSTFDGANPNSCTAKRPDTMVPQQALFALNSEFVQDRAKRLAELSKSNANSDVDRLTWLYRVVYSRDPEPLEQQMALRFVNFNQSNGQPETNNSELWCQLAHVLLAANEFVFLD